jgi:glycyl-tRNA synthetase beta subunit
MSNNDEWVLRKQTQLLQDMIEAKSISIELLDCLTTLTRVLVSQATERGIEIPNREAIHHLVSRCQTLLETSGEASEVILHGRPRDKLTP